MSWRYPSIGTGNSGKDHVPMAAPRRAESARIIDSVTERINWRVALPVTALGVGLIFAGLAADRFSSAAWSGVLVSLGAAVGLVVILLVLQRGMIRSVTEAATSVATATVERETAGLRDRILRLEDLDQAQARGRERRRRDADEMVERLLDDELTPASVSDLVVSAYQDGLFAPDRFRVKN